MLRVVKPLQHPYVYQQDHNQGSLWSIWYERFNVLTPAQKIYELTSHKTITIIYNVFQIGFLFDSFKAMLSINKISDDNLKFKINDE